MMGLSERFAMSIPRRDFMKLFGISLGSLLLARCQVPGVPTPQTTCYTVGPITPSGPTPMPKSLTPRERLRLCWLRFGELAQSTRDAALKGEGNGEDDPLGNRMIAEHRAALDELVSGGEIYGPVSDLVHEAYCAAVYHVWRSNAPMTCYEPAIVDFAPVSADILVHQSEVLAEIAAESTIDPATLAGARSALEHDLAFYALSDADVQALYARLLEQWQTAGGDIPSFDSVEFALTPDVRAAAQFLLDLLTGK
jgi:hypothetical protein